MSTFDPRLYERQEGTRPRTCVRPSCENPVDGMATICATCLPFQAAVLAEIEGVQAEARNERLARQRQERETAA